MASASTLWSHHPVAVFSGAKLVQRSAGSSFRRRLGTITAAANIEQQSNRAVVSSGDDRLEISRVINGMWQTSGGWGKIDRDDAVDAMMRYVDSGFDTFDMADHCKPPFDSVSCSHSSGYGAHSVSSIVQFTYTTQRLQNKKQNVVKAFHNWYRRFKRD